MGRREVALTLADLLPYLILGLAVAFASYLVFFVLVPKVLSVSSSLMSDYVKPVIVNVTA